MLGAVMAVIAQFLLWLIEFITSLSFFGKIGIASSPAGNHLGLAVIAIPVLGGLIVGFMARFGSPAIRGHGIPEAMEQVLENSSRIPARITWLKPLSAAISIGTGGPFGAEGPIIATGGASGSLMGQILPTSATERKILLAAGAAAGMAATFGSPLSALLLAVELLLFEFNVRSLIPVALSVSIASLIRTKLVGTMPIFEMPRVLAPTAPAFVSLLLIASLMGVAAFGLSRITYLIEDGFEKLPFHWMWWPALGGIAVGCVGYFSPKTLGVGYSNITENLSGSMPLLAVAALCIFKFLSWSISLGSGTSGGTLAPLMTIGSGLGWILGVAIQQFIPDLDPHLAALIGMACIFGGASQAMLAAAVFAYETTGQSAAIFSLLACCGVAVWVARTLGKNSIMTEKIVRRGISVPLQFSTDIFEHTHVAHVMDTARVTVNAGMLIKELGQKIATHDPELRAHHAHPVVSDEGRLLGIITRGDVIRAIENASPGATVLDYATTNLVVAFPNETLHEAIQKLLKHDIGRLLVVSPHDPEKLIGYLSRSAILSARWKISEQEKVEVSHWHPWSKVSSL